MSPFLIGWGGPLLILGLFVLINRPWMCHPYRVAVVTYALSILTGILISVTQDVTDLGGATIAGVYAPIGYAFVFTALNVVHVILKRFGLEYQFTGERYAFLRKMTRWGGVAVGAFIGGVIGLIVGGGLSLLIALVFQIDPFPTNTVLSELDVNLVISVSIYFFGAVGVFAGAIYWLTVADPRK